MNCREIREIVALDADEKSIEQRERETAHLRTCGECSAFAETFALPMTSFRSELPLGDTDFAAIRRNVLAATAPRPPRESFLFRLAAVAAAAVVLILIVRRPAEPPVRVRDAKSTSRSETTVPSVASASPQGETVSRGVAEIPVSRGVAEIQVPRGETATVSEEPLHLEIQTSDPDVRIIWIANQTPPDLTFSTEDDETLGEELSETR